MMQVRTFFVWCVGILAFTSIIIVAIITPEAPPEPIQAGVTKTIKSPDVYQKVFDQCIKASSNQVRECKWTAESASEVIVYWDGNNWKLPQ